LCFQNKSGDVFCFSIETKKTFEEEQSLGERSKQTQSELSKKNPFITFLSFPDSLLLFFAHTHTVRKNNAVSKVIERES
jgi:hypothetical protein